MKGLWVIKYLKNMFKGYENGYRHLGGSVYDVKNQNGFNNALYNEIGVGGILDKKDIRSMVVNYPTKYPCTIQIRSMVFEFNR